MDSAGAGVILLGSMLLTSYGLYVYCNVLKSPHDLFLQVKPFVPR